MMNSYSKRGIAGRSLLQGMVAALLALSCGLSAADGPLRVIGIGDSLTQGTMDGTNNARNTLNAYLQKVVLSLGQSTQVLSRQPLYNQEGRRLRPFVTPTNLGVDGSDSFAMEGVEYYKRVGAPVSFVTDDYLCEPINPQLLDDDYDKVLYPIDLWLGRPVSQIDALEWWLDRIAAEAQPVETAILFWIGNNDASTASLGTGGANPAVLPIPLDQVEPALTAKARLVLRTAEQAGELSFAPYTQAFIDRNLTDAADFEQQFNRLIGNLQNKLSEMPSDKPVHVYLLTLPYYTAAGYLMDADDLESHLRQLDPGYAVPASFTRPDPASTAASNGDRVSVITFGLMYSLLASGYPVAHVNQVLEQAGVQNDGMVLSEAEQAFVVARLDHFNNVIRTAAQDAADAGFQVHLVDVGSHLNDILLGNSQLVVDGRQISRHWGRGDAFSLDGVHPGYVGHAVIANQVLVAINQAQQLGAPAVDLESVSQRDPYADRDGDGWVSGTDAASQGIPGLLALLRDPDDSDPAAVPVLPADVWQQISDAILEQLKP